MKPRDATAHIAAAPDPYALSAWLNGTRELRGLARVASRTPDEGQMGTIADVVAVAVGSSGVAAILIGKVYDWIVLRRDAGSLTVKIVRSDGTSVEITVDRAQDRAELIESARRLLEPDDDPGD